MGRLLADELDPATAAAAKLWTTETQCKVIDACQQLFGGYGYMAEYPIARLYTDARVSRIYGGANEIMKLMVARSLCSGRPTSNSMTTAGSDSVGMNPLPNPRQSEEG